MSELHVPQHPVRLVTASSLFDGHDASINIMRRILQGMGGAMMTPVGRLVLLRSIDKSALVNAMAWVTVPALVGPVIGHHQPRAHLVWELLFDGLDPAPGVDIADGKADRMLRRRLRDQ